MRFCNCSRKCKRGCFDPQLFLDKTPIEFVKEHKFLGLIWDCKLSFRAHVEYLKKRCMQALQIIRVVAHSQWGSDTKTLLRLFRSLVRSKLDYGSIVYMSGDERSLEKLNIVHRHGLRLCLGAFKSSPIEALYAEANELPLELRREELAMRYALKIKANPDNAVYNSIYKSPNEIKSEKSLGESISRLFDEAEINTDKITTSKIPDTPIWCSEPNEVSFKLSVYDKSTTNPDLFKSKFLSEVLPDYKDYFQIYTDGSKQDEKAAFGVYLKPYGSLANSITHDSSIFTAELEGIKRAFQFIGDSQKSAGKNQQHGKKFVIFCDSKSVLESIENQSSKNPIMIDILDTLQKFKRSGFIIKFCWIPSHVGIRGNEIADQKAKGALNNPPPAYHQVPYSDYIPKVKTYIRKKWQKRWDNKHRARPIKLHEIMPVIRPFYLNGLARKDEIKIHRLRIGHTRVTTKYLMERDQEPICDNCNEDNPFTVKHILIECSDFEYIRQNYFRATNMQDLFEGIPLGRIIGFLKKVNLYDKI